MAHDQRTLVEELKKKGVLKSPRLIRAFEAVDRADFVVSDLHLAYEDTALSIGSGQTISQPYTVAFMLELLDVRPGHNILEAGYGSGWQTALLAHLAGHRGAAYAMEVVPELCEQGGENLKRYSELLPRIHLFCRSAATGCIEGAPFDRIVAAAEVAVVPEAWRAQLTLGGIMVYPEHGGLVFEKKIEKGFESKRFPGFAFVPFM